MVVPHVCFVLRTCQVWVLVDHLEVPELLLLPMELLYVVFKAKFAGDGDGENSHAPINKCRQLAFQFGHSLFFE